jgi:hypothetical protein
MRIRRILLWALPVVALLGAGTIGIDAAVADGAPAAATPNSVHACTNGQVVSWLNTASDGYAGGIGYELQFTNVSTHECSLFGFPGVSAVDVAGHQIGAAATQDGGVRHTIDVQPGATARATLLVVETGNFPVSACRPVTADGLRVYAPNQTYSDVIPFPFSVCSRSATVSLLIQATTH